MFALRNETGAFFVGMRKGAPVWTDARCEAHWFPRRATAGNKARALGLTTYRVQHITA